MKEQICTDSCPVFNLKLGHQISRVELLPSEGAYGFNNTWRGNQAHTELLNATFLFFIDVERVMYKVLLK